jgi:hypothetical protein
MISVARFLSFVINCALNFLVSKFTLILSCAADLSYLCTQNVMSDGKVSFPGWSLTSNRGKSYNNKTTNVSYLSPVFSLSPRWRCSPVAFDALQNWRHCVHVFHSSIVIRQEMLTNLLIFWFPNVVSPSHNLVFFFFLQSKRNVDNFK